MGAFIRTAVNTIKKNITMNIITTLQISAVFVITVIMVSAVCVRYRCYTPFRDYFEGNGLFCIFSVEAYTGNIDKVYDVIEDTNELMSYLHGPEKIVACHHLSAYAEVNDQICDIQGLSYDDEIIDRYEPELEYGRWISTDKEADMIEAVVSENDYGWNVGDIIQIVMLNTETSVKRDVKIVGILKENTKIPGLFSARIGTDTYNLFYYPYSYEYEGKPLLLFSYSQLAGLENAPLQGIYQSNLIRYDDSVSAEEIEQDQRLMSTMGCVFSTDLKELDKNSKDYLHRHIYDLLPIIIVLLILVVVSSISSSALSTRKRLRDYAIYYVTGLQWRQCILINLLQSVIIIISAFILSIVCVAVLRYTNLSDMFYISWNKYILFSFAGITVFYIIISMIMPLIMIFNVTPKQILTK